MEDAVPMPAASTSMVDVPGSVEVAAKWQAPADAAAVFVFAHGAGAGMDHPFMAALAAALAARSVATLRYQFPFMQRGSRRVDAPTVAQAAVRAAVAAAAARRPDLPLFAGGKSFGGRMTSQAQAATPLPRVRGLAFVGFPLHPAGKPAIDRADHLLAVNCPMLFVQGTRDDLADLALLRTALLPLQERATLHVIEGADHGFHVRGRGGDERAIGSVADAMAAWFAALSGS